MKNITVKVIEYTLAKDADAEAFKKASASLMPEIKTFKGFSRRELHKDEGGRWRDVVYWEGRKDADQSELDIPNLPSCVKCVAMMDPSDMTVTHFELIQESQSQFV